MGDGKRRSPGVSPGPSLGATTQTPSIDIADVATSNQFAALASIAPEYSPLAFIDIDLKSPEAGEWIAARAMLDCGGQGSFINSNLSHCYPLPRCPKPHPIALILADGSQSQAGHVTHFNPLLLHTAGHEEPLSLDIAATSHDVILGMPWLSKHDPAIRFGQRELTFDSPFCREHCAHYGKTIPLHPGSLHSPYEAMPTSHGETLVMSSLAPHPDALSHHEATSHPDTRPQSRCDAAY